MDDDNQLTAAEQAELDAQRGAVPAAPARGRRSAVPPEPAEGEDHPEPPAVPGAPQDDDAEASAAEGGDPAAAQASKRPQMVPHAALHEERVRRQEVERQAAEDRRKYEARFEEVLKLVPQPAPAAARPAEQPLPDFNADPAGYIVATMQRQGATLEQTQQALAELRAQQQQQQAVAAVQQHTAAAETAYRAANPDYDSALEYMRQFRDRQLAAAGMADPAQRAQQIASEYLQMSAMTLQQGGNPAERLHRIAEASGWARPAPAGQPQGASNALAPPDPAAQLRVAQQGQEHSRGLGAVRGSGPSPMTAARLLEMDDDAFLEAMRKSKDARRLMGA